MQSGWNKFYIVLLLLITAGLLHLLSPILTPFFVAALLAYLADPLVTQLTRLRIPRTLSVVIVFLLLFNVIILIILLLIPMIQKQIVLLIDAIPDAVVRIQTTIVPWLNTHFGFNESLDVETLKQTLAENWSKAGGLATWAWKTALHSGTALLHWIMALVLVPVVTFYLLRDWHQVVQGLRNLLPRRIEKTVVKLVEECNSVLSAFFRGQFLVMLSLGLIYGTGLTLIGLQVGLMIGLIAGLASIVPYLGFIVGFSIASVSAYMQFGTFNAIFPVFLVFLVGQVMEGSVLTPIFVGKRIGLHPVAVIFAVLTGASLFGFMGVLLALPVAAVIMVLLRFLNQRYRDSRLYQ